MFWRPDPLVDAARKLPDWLPFHRIAGRNGLYFDRIERDGKRYTCQAYTLHRTSTGGWRHETLALGRGATVLDAMFDAYAQSGRTVPDLAPLVARRLVGDDFSMVAESDFDALL